MPSRSVIRCGARYPLAVDRRSPDLPSAARLSNEPAGTESHLPEGPQFAADATLLHHQRADLDNPG